jgi:hypothetical protein
MATEDDIAAIEAILQEGASRVTTDGVTVQFDLAALKARLAALRREATPTARPKIAQADLSGFAS